ncbi:MAG: response regulator, partial [Desulfurivibrionaceae bacterium]|nr:response regulator [Desulfurivibrionaceae bacterium]
VTAPAGQELLPRGHGKMVLVVEDEEAILEMTGKILINLGYQVLAASLPSRAIRLGREHAGAIDLLITDVVMPEMNGRELADQIHAFCPDLNTLFMSGYTADIIAQRGVLGDGVHFMQKPFSRKDLAHKVHKILTGS